MCALARRSLSVLLPRLRIRRGIVALAKIVGSAKAAIWFHGRHYVEPPLNSTLSVLASV
jgi:hypothetical protein